MSDGAVVKDHEAFIWSVADLRRGDTVPSQVRPLAPVLMEA